MKFRLVAYILSGQSAGGVAFIAIDQNRNIQDIDFNQLKVQCLKTIKFWKL